MTTVIESEAVVVGEIDGSAEAETDAEVFTGEPLPSGNDG